MCGCVSEEEEEQEEEGKGRGVRIQWWWAVMTLGELLGKYTLVMQPCFTSHTSACSFIMTTHQNTHAHTHQPMLAVLYCSICALSLCPTLPHSVSLHVHTYGHISLQLMPLLLRLPVPPPPADRPGLTGSSTPCQQTYTRIHIHTHTHTHAHNTGSVFVRVCGVVVVGKKEGVRGVMIL